MLLHYLGKLKIQIFCSYSADMEKNANKLRFECTDFNSIYLYAWLNEKEWRTAEHYISDLLNVGRQRSKCSVAMLCFIVSRGA